MKWMVQGPYMNVSLAVGSWPPSLTSLSAPFHCSPQSLLWDATRTLPPVRGSRCLEETLCCWRCAWLTTQNHSVGARISGYDLEGMMTATWNAPTTVSFTWILSWHSYIDHSPHFTSPLSLSWHLCARNRFYSQACLYHYIYCYH